MVKLCTSENIWQSQESLFADIWRGGGWCRGGGRKFAKSNLERFLFALLVRHYQKNTVQILTVLFIINGLPSINLFWSKLIISKWLSNGVMGGGGRTVHYEMSNIRSITRKKGYTVQYTRVGRFLTIRKFGNSWKGLDSVVIRHIIFNNKNSFCLGG